MRIITYSLLVFPVLLALSACAPVPDGVKVWTESPASVEIGEEFEIHAHILNESDSQVRLYSIDIGDDFLAGVTIEGSTPSFSEVSHIPIDNTMEHLLKIDVQPGEHLVVSFTAKPSKVGNHIGDFDFCFNALASCIFETISVSVSGTQ